MSWKSQVIHISDTTVDDLDGVGLTRTGERIAGDEAATEGCGVMPLGDGLLILSASGDPDLPRTLFERFRRSGRMREVTGAHFMGTVDFWRWEVHRDGSSRLWQTVQGEVTDDSGAPVAAEDGIDELTEDSLWQILEAHLGALPDWGFAELDELDLDAWMADENTTAPDETEPRRKGRWGRLFGR